MEAFESKKNVMRKFFLHGSLAENDRVVDLQLQDELVQEYLL